MASKWNGLKGKLPAFEQEPVWQGRVDEVKKEFVGFDTAELARAFGMARARKKELEEKVSLENLQLEALSQLLVNELESCELQKVQLGSGETVYIQTEPYCSVQEKETVIAWLKKKKLSAMLTVQWQTLNSFVKEQLSNGVPTPPGVAVYLKTSARLRGGNSNTGEE